MTPTSQPQYEFLMEKIADKTLSFGLILASKNGEKRYFVEKCANRMIGYYRAMKMEPTTFVDFENNAGIYTDDIFWHENSTKIIGHEPTLARVLSSLSHLDFNVPDNYTNAMYKWCWEHDRLCDQSDETIIWLAELFGYQKNS